MSVVIVGSLLHFLWQGALIGLVAWVAMKIARTPQMRYVIGVVALALMAAAPVVTATKIARNPDVRRSTFEVQRPLSSDVLGSTSAPGRPDDGGRSTSDLGRARTSDLARRTSDFLKSVSAVSPSVSQKLLVAWLIGVAFLSLRLCVGWWTARRLTRVSVSQPRLEILSHAERIMGGLKIQGAVTVLESALVKVPMTMGWWKPVVLLPAAAMTGLSLEQVDALVAHELAHVRRHDYLVNLAQSAIETLLFYHPAVWLVSRAIRHERELCCDDIALEVCGSDSVTYASALADLEQMRVAEPALAANGGSLLVRVKRILGHDAAAVSRSRTNWSAGVALLSLALVLLPINAARPKATALPEGAKIVEAETNLGDGFAPLLQKAPTAGVVGAASPNTQPSATNSQPGGIVGITPLPPAIDFTRDLGRPDVASRTEAVATQDADRRDQTGRDGFGPFRVGDDISIEMGFYTDPERTRHFATVGADGSVAIEKIGLVAIAGRMAGAIAKDVAGRLFEVNGGKSTAVAVQLDPRSSRNKSATERRDDWTPRVIGDASQSAIASGQLLRLEVTVGVVRQTEFSKDYTVQPDGFISLPYVGRMKVAGLTIDAAQEAVRALLSDKGTLPGAKVVATLEGRSSDASIFVLGEVNAPNVYPWREGMTIAQAISLAGGAKIAGTPVDVLGSHGGIQKPTDLSQPVPSGATINVLAFRSIAVKAQGAVSRPGNVTMREDKTALTDVLTMAGGLTPAAGVTIRIKRAAAPEWLEYSVSDLNTGRLANIKLADGDTVDVPVAPRYYVQGFVNSPGDLQWEPNMSLQKAILKAGGVTKDGAINRITVRRLNRETKKYEAMDLGKDPMQFIVQPDDVIEVPKRRL